MRTPYEQIVDVQAIGRKNPLAVNHLFDLAAKEFVPPAAHDEEKILVIGIDVQNDFMETGELAVPGSHQDVHNFTRFIYSNLNRITRIAVSLDTHQPLQIFHPAWWGNAAHEAPKPFTLITLADIDAGTWVPRYAPRDSRDYVANLESSGRKQLVIWPYHCLQGTFGGSLEGQFSNLVYFHSAVRQSELLRIVKGEDVLSEMYGIIKPEYDKNGYMNRELLDELLKYDKIFIGGEAKSHCVLESLVQIVEHFHDVPSLTQKIYLLEDCMSNIPGFERATEETLQNVSEQYGVHRVPMSANLLV
ncbi:MAG: hypothetical protein A2201_08240 [Alicyclobacillus sp. RIFOXYA1_FULL_53_8]|nr:MAG: hypothetical protein A2201_08240 [Alicyclobacillus sp. RIFOXYA1_FULL_53_8]